MLEWLIDFSLRKRGLVVCCALILAGVAFALMLGSYSPEDPGWMVASDKPIANTLGSYGAAIASTLIIIGGKGAWGDMVMPPNAHVKDADIQALVKWTLTLK
mgnify:CR=1 FL=1